MWDSNPQDLSAYQRLKLTCTAKYHQSRFVWSRIEGMSLPQIYLCSVLRDTRHYLVGSLGFKPRSQAPCACVLADKLLPVIYWVTGHRTRYWPVYQDPLFVRLVVSGVSHILSASQCYWANVFTLRRFYRCLGYHNGFAGSPWIPTTIGY